MSTTPTPLDVLHAHIAALTRQLAEATRERDAYLATVRGLETENDRLGRDLAAANTVIARMREALVRSNEQLDGGQFTRENGLNALNRNKQALALTPAGVRDELAAITAERDSLLRDKERLEHCMEHWMIVHPSVRLKDNEEVLLDREEIDAAVAAQRPTTKGGV